MAQLAYLAVITLEAFEKGDGHAIRSQLKRVADNHAPINREFAF